MRGEDTGPVHVDDLAAELGYTVTEVGLTVMMLGTTSRPDVRGYHGPVIPGRVADAVRQAAAESRR